MSEASTDYSVVAGLLYDGLSLEPSTDMVIHVSGGRIADVEKARPKDFHAARLRADIVAPGFIDLQINGANDVQFNATPTSDALERIAAGARKGGTAHILPTFTTAPGAEYRKAIQAVQNAQAAGVAGILGVHLEGPFLSPECAGIHPVEFIRSPDGSDLRFLCDADCGVRFITLAPERQPEGVIASLVESGWVVFAGHSAANSMEMDRATAQGVSGATHLFNAMSQLASREPGVVGAVLASNRMSAGVIVDGVHVHPQTVKLACRSLGERLCLVTDAVLTLAGNTVEFDFYGKRIFRTGNRLADASGRLAGAHLSMDEAVRNLMSFAEVDKGAALYAASRSPARAIGLGHELGCVHPGYRASLTFMTQDLKPAGVVVDGDAFV